MAKKFTRRRWRRPERMTLEHPPVERRKDLSAPDALPLEPELARKTSHRRRNAFLTLFFVFCAIEGAVIGLFVLTLWLTTVIAVAYGAFYLALAREFGDEWLCRALRVRGKAESRLERLARSESGSASVAAPRVLVTQGDACNALAVSLRKRTIVATAASETEDELQLEAMLAHEVVHLRDGEAFLASLYFVLAGAPDIALRRGGVLSLLSLPLWPASIALRFARAIAITPDREHRADIAAAMLTRYPPGLVEALRTSGGTTSGLRVTDAFWFVRRDNSGVRDAERRADLVAEM